jgi:hypothetical protein
LESNDFSDARVNLAMSSLYKETSTATVAGWAELAKREGNTEEARNQLDFWLIASKTTIGGSISIFSVLVSEGSHLVLCLAF